jgi:hypothetical protein
MPLDQIDYTVNISGKYGLAYFDLPKGGCSTIKSIFQELERNEIWSEEENTDLEKIHIKELSPLLSPSDIGFGKFFRMMERNKIFCFTFSRNPFSRVLSGYLDKILGHEEEKIGILHILGRNYLEIGQHITFDEYISALFKLRHDPIKLNCHWRPMTLQLFADIVQFDFVGRIENFEEDIYELGQRLNIKKVKQYAKRRIHIRDASDKCKDYYCDSTKKMIIEIYEEDFKYFGYNFEFP